jgi:hypothetical protein
LLGITILGEVPPSDASSDNTFGYLVTRLVSWLT